MDSSLILIAIVVAVALAFDFTNGFHDTTNAMATTVATGAIPPRVAVIVAGVLNFVGAFLSLKVAATKASGIVSSELTTPAIVFAGLVGAIVAAPTHSPLLSPTQPGQLRAPPPVCG